MKNLHQLLLPMLMACALLTTGAEGRDLRFFVFGKDPSLTSTTVDNMDGTKTISLEGELINSQSAKLLQVIITGEESNQVVLEMSGVTVIDKSGIAALITAVSYFGESGGILAIANVPTTIAATIQESSDAPTLYDDVESAIASFSG